MWPPYTITSPDRSDATVRMRVYQCTASRLSFPPVNQHTVATFFFCLNPRYFSGPDSQQASFNPELFFFSRPTENSWFDRCPAGSHIPPLPPLQPTQGDSLSETSSPPTAAQCSQWFRTSSSLRQTSSACWWGQQALRGLTVPLSRPLLRPTRSFKQIITGFCILPLAKWRQDPDLSPSTNKLSRCINAQCVPFVIRHKKRAQKIRADQIVLFKQISLNFSTAPCSARWKDLSMCVSPEWSSFSWRPRK